MKSFPALGLSGPLVELIQQLGFETPTPVQEKAIPVLLQGTTDVVALAQTGTGKTAAFGLPLVELIDEKMRQPQALVLAPTRELCVQITNDLERFSQSYKDLRTVAVYGGASIGDQIRKIRQGVNVVIATPGRLIDLLSRKALQLQTIRYVVLDEADEMLNMGFKEDIDEILATTPDTKTTWLFSATMPREVRQIAQAYMRDPEEITTGARNQANENIAHQYMVVNERDKYLALKRVLDYTPDMYGLVFCRTKMDTQQVAEHLMKDGYSADALHGDLSQQQRDKVMRSFRNKAIQVLVATDVAARGIDVDNLTHVVHLNLPDEIEYYTHRAGRTARAGRKGISLAIIGKRDRGRIGQIEKMLNKRFAQIPVPTGDEICTKKLLDLMHQVKSVEVNEEEIDSFLPDVYHELTNLSKEEIIKRFASIEFNQIYKYYRDAPDLNAPQASRTDAAPDDGYATGERIFINVGKMDGLDKGSLLALVCDFGEVSKKQVGKIDLKGAYSFFEVEPALVEKVMKGFEGVQVRGRSVRLEVSGPKSDGPRSDRERQPRKKSSKRDPFWGKRKK
jgi:ATP-dependent RNA helicase DeaD